MECGVENHCHSSMVGKQGVYWLGKSWPCLLEDHETLSLTYAGWFRVSAINITRIIWSWSNSNTSSISMFSDIMFRKPIEIENPIFWDWWRFDTIEINLWWLFQCLVHLCLIFLYAFFCGSATSSDFCWSRDDLSLFRFKGQDNMGFLWKIRSTIFKKIQINTTHLGVAKIIIWKLNSFK